MESKAESHAGTMAWIGLDAGVLAWDMFGAETLSHAIDRGLASKIGRIAIPLTTMMTAAHILNIYEHFGVEQYDPFNILFCVERSKVLSVTHTTGRMGHTYFSMSTILLAYA